MFNLFSYCSGNHNFNSMKPTLISVERKRTELFLFACCLFLAFLLNLISILIYKTSWKELLTQLHIVALLAVILYSLVIFFRVLYGLVRRIIFRKG